MTPSDNPVTDIAVVGGGLTGIPLALVLAAAGWHVTLFDQSNRPQNISLTDSLEQQCIALSAGSVLWLREHNLWPLLADHACAINRVHVSQQGFFGATRLHAEELGVHALGQVVEVRQFLQDLAPAVVASQSLEHVSATVTSVDTKADHVVIHSDAGQSDVRARLLIAVDGTTSRVRESLSIGTRQVDYNQAAVLGTVALDQPHSNTAFERFTGTGPLALLPRPDNHMSFVECIDPADQSRIKSLDNADYLAHLQSRFGHRLGRFRATGSRLVVPLLRIEATQQTGPRCVLLGNAVRLLHPIAGQGYNLALRDVAELVRQLGAGGQLVGTADAGNRGNGKQMIDPGDARLLARFVEKRRDDQQQVVRLTDALARSFRGEWSALSHLRALGLLSIDTITPLRRRFARRTMGL
ncbi:MAG: FAD-dependent monooxygenase [Granulosicoccus sp.]